MASTDIHGEVFAIIMPLNADGNGPCDEAEASVITWEVWDQVCQVICSCRSEEDARYIAELINYDGRYP